MKKIFGALSALMLVVIATAMMMSPASATPGNGNPDKNIGICHATGSDSNPYEFIEVSKHSIVNGGHGRDADDIIPEFGYTFEGGPSGGVGRYPGKNLDKIGLLSQDPKCVEPVVEQEIAVPAVNKVDNCEKDTDRVEPVRDDAKYDTVVNDRVGDTVKVVFTAKDGFTFPTGKTVEVTVDFPNNDDCDLPVTGGAAQYNTMLGLAAMMGVVLLGGATVLTRQRN